MRNKIVAGNWKMNFGPDEAKNFVMNFKKEFSIKQPNVVILPSAICLTTVLAVSGDQFSVGGQNCHFENTGAFTGENSPETLKKIGAKYCLVGHSERRTLFKETISETSKKVRSLQKNQITPILCIGETLQERQAQKTEKVLKEQLLGGLCEAALTPTLVVAYEPVWAIGTGQVATPEQVQGAHAFIRKELMQLQPDLQNISILYGGSVKPENAKGLSTLADVDGFLVGGASLEPKSFSQLCNLYFS